MADMVTLVNTILANGSEEYAARVPEATRDNITAVGNAILSYSTLTNEFLNSLVNKIGMTIVRNRIATNRLAVLKKGGMPLGVDVEELFTNPATAKKHGDTSTTLLTQHTPDTHAIYHRRNRQDQYAVTIKRPHLMAAFTSWEKLEELLATIVNSLYSGDNLDEYVLMKNLMAEAITGNKVLTVEAGDAKADGGAASLVKQLVNAGKLMQFAGSNFNVFKSVMGAQVPPVTVSDVITWTPPEDLVMILRSDIATDINIDVLAAAFQLDKIQLQSNIIEVDNFGAAEVAAEAGVSDGRTVYGMVGDRAWFQVYDNWQDLADFYNAKEKSWNYYWDHWQTLSISLFANACFFCHTIPK